MSEAVSPGQGESEVASASVGDLAVRTSEIVATLDRELAEIEMLVQQAKVEAGRHEAKRVQASERLDAIGKRAETADPKEVLEVSVQLAPLTRRAVLMDAQVELLEGKAKVLARYRDGMTSLATDLGAAPAGASALIGQPGSRSSTDAHRESAAVTRMLLGAQEDLRREIARAMHDGPAQSLTNIVLQAQIVERLLARDPEEARSEVHQLVAMVQTTLDATKAFIFDVRPMVLDDLGLVPTLRRAARERGRRAQIAVEFESLGPDRRLSMELESGLFRILDEAMSAFLSGGPDNVSVRLDWGDHQVEARVTAQRAAPEEQPATEEEPTPDPKRGRGKQAEKQAEMPAALAAMIEDRKADQSAAIEAARVASLVPLPPAAWREIQDRATTLGIAAELLAEGTEVHLTADVAGPTADLAGPAEEQ
jgi:two-component system sensor histidine kinase DegS